MPLRPGLLWVTLNLAVVGQCLSRNNLFSVLHFCEMFSRTPGRILDNLLSDCGEVVSLTRRLRFNPQDDEHEVDGISRTIVLYPDQRRLNFEDRRVTNPVPTLRNGGI
jgi:hypothetical protein